MPSAKDNYKINPVSDKPEISGVYFKKLTTYNDERGSLTELWSQPWSISEPVADQIAHVYFNTTLEGVRKGWHYHKNTFSQYTCVSGLMQVVLIDNRPDSNTFKTVDQFIIGTKNPAFIKIPPGVIKGWKSLIDNSVIVNLLTSADVNDNYKIPIDDLLPDIWHE